MYTLEAMITRIKGYIEQEKKTVGNYSSCIDGSHECALSMDTIYHELKELLKEKQARYDDLQERYGSKNGEK